MKQRIALTSAATLAALLFGGSAANAAPLDLRAGDYSIKFTGYQQLAPEGAEEYNESAWGVVRGTSYSVDGEDEWSTGNEGIFGMFHGFEPYSTDEDDPIDEFVSQGGQIDLYQHSDVSGGSFGNLDSLDLGGDDDNIPLPSNRDGEDSFGELTDTNPDEVTQLVSLAFEPGVAEDDTATLTGDEDPVDTSDGTFFGRAGGYADVIDDSGIWANQIERNTYQTNGYLRDVQFTSSYEEQGEWNSGDVVGATIDDPAEFTAVPAPGTLVLMGFGLLGLGGIAGAARGKRQSP